MKKFLYSILFLFFLLITIHYQENLVIIKNGLKVYFEILFPNMFLSMVCIYVLHYANFFSSFSYRFLCKVWNMNHHAVALSITCILLGFPIASCLIDESYQKHDLNYYEASRLFYCIHISKLSFIVNQCGMLLFQNFKLSLLLYLVQILSVFILLCLTSKQRIHLNKLATKSFPSSLNLAFIQSITSLFFIGGYYLMILCFSQLSAYYLPNSLSNILALLLEISNGIIILQQSNFSNLCLFVLTSIYLMFASFSIHLQIFSMIQSLKVSYFKFLAYRILHFIIILFLCMIIAIFI